MYLHETNLAERDRTMSNNDEGQVVWGEVVEDAETGEYSVNNPVPVKASMSSAERTRRAMSLKLAGASYAQIAMTLGYHDASGARKAVQRGMKNALQETSSELRKIHYGRLEHMLMLLWPDVNNRDLGSLNTALAVMDRMERLYGLNAAEKIDVMNVNNTVILADGDKTSYIAALREAGKQLALGVSSSSPEEEQDDDDDTIDYNYDGEEEEGAGDASD